MKSETEKENNDHIIVGKISSPHGVKGYIKLYSYMAIPDDIFNHSLTVEKGGLIKLTKISAAPKFFIAQIEGIASRDECEKLKNKKLFVKRSALPELSTDEYYQSDLINFMVISADQIPLGRVIKFHNFGGGDCMEIENCKDMVSFDNRTIADVNLEARTINLRLPI